MTTFLVLCLVCGLIMVTVIIVQSGSFTKPILGLQKAMKKVSGGDMTVRVTHNRKDEFGELSEGFNRLVGELDQLITHVAESNQRENLAKYQMLQSQINPHFLYNTLDTIRMMAVLQDQDDISEALICLSNLFRYCIRQGDRLVTVREELQQVKNYLEIFQTVLKY
jgi:two-component system sensor histidine kinase YesM